MSLVPDPTPVPESGLARYRILSPNAGAHVSPIVLGAMSIGDKWDGMGAMSKESSFKLLDTYFNQGGNFIDTASNYQDGASEEFIGEWAEKRGIRDQLFIATKYGNDKNVNDESRQQKVLFFGNSAKNMRLSIESSLKRFRTSYIDLYYLHYWDWDTSVEEVMRHLNILVQQGKVLYLGVSDTPAWVVVKANAYARQHGLTPFSYIKAIGMFWTGMALAPWGVLAGGKFRTDEEEERRRKTGENGRIILDAQWERTEAEKKVSKALERVASEIGAKHITSVAIAYLMHKTTYVFPIIGGRKPEYLLANLEALSISLSTEQIKYLESASEFDVGFPINFIGDGSARAPIIEILTRGHVDKQPLPEPIRPSVKRTSGN